MLETLQQLKRLAALTRIELFSDKKKEEFSLDFIWKSVDNKPLKSNDGITDRGKKGGRFTIRTKECEKWRKCCTVVPSAPKLKSNVVPHQENPSVFWPERGKYSVQGFHLNIGVTGSKKICQLQKTHFTAKVSAFLPHYGRPAGQTPTLQAQMSQTRSFKWDSTQNEYLPPLDNPVNRVSELVRLKRFQNYNKCSTWSSADQKHSGSQMGSVKCHFCSECCLTRSSVESPLTPEQIWAAETAVQLHCVQDVF